MGMRYMGAAFLLLTMTACGQSSSPSPLSPNGSSACSYGVNPVAQSAPASGGTFTANVMSTGNCQWTAAAEVPWIAVSPGATGSGVLTYTVEPNDAVARQGLVDVSVAGGGKVKLTISQSAAQ